MRKGSLALFVIHIIFCMAVRAQDHLPHYTAKSENLKDKVHYVKSITYALDPGKGNSTVEKELYGVKTIFYPDGFVDSSFYKIAGRDFELSYHYFWNGDTLMSTVHRTGDYSKVLFSKGGLPLYQFTAQAGGREFEQWYSYDSKLHLTRMINRSNQRTDTTIWTYTAVGQKMLKAVVSNPGKKNPLQPGFELFDSAGHKQSEQWNSDNTHRIERTFEYDINGNLIFEEFKGWILQNGTWQKEYTPTVRNYRYTYDDRRNWIICETLDNGSLVQVERRSILYY